jgi:hypothetical protein
VDPFLLHKQSATLSLVLLKRRVFPATMVEVKQNCPKMQLSPMCRMQVIDVSAVEQLVEPSQTRAIAAALMLIRTHVQQQRQPETVAQMIGGLVKRMDGPAGLDAIAAGRGDCARPRDLEIAAAVNRIRSLVVQQCI